MDIGARQPYAQWRFLQMTIVIMAWMLLSPNLDTRFGGHVAMHVLLLDLILVTMWANPDWSRTVRVIIALWVVSLIASVASILELIPALGKVERTLDVALSAPVTAACAVGVLAFAFRAERPTLDGIFAMVVVYLLVAMIFAELFYLLLIWEPQAMHLLTPVGETTPRELRGELIYFSLVTLSTVGYGDVLAVSPTARMLAVIEAVIGQFFVAVVVGMFVGMYAAHGLDRRRQR
jgi:hypothetical protein